MAKKVAVVTGASSGIGRETSRALYAAGWAVCLIGRREAELQETAKEFAKEDHLCIPGDLTKPDFVQEAFTKVKERFGRLDLLFNNAGIAKGGPIDEISYQDFLDTININLNASFLCSQQAFKLMKAQSPQGGRIINNGSISAFVPRPNSAPYTCSKHAITGLTKSCALDGRQYSIAVSQIDIGNCVTAVSATTAGSKGSLQADLSHKVEDTMEVKHAADAVVYMAGLPLHVNVLSQTIMATNMPSYVGRG